MKNPGFLVKTKSGKIGRTFHSKGLINGKVPVYLGAKNEELEESAKIDDFLDFISNVKFGNEKILCSIDSLIKLGYID